MSAISVEDELVYEQRVRNRQVGAAVVAAVLIVVAAIVQVTGVHTNVDELTLDLVTEHKRATTDLIGSILEAVAYGALAWTLAYLAQITRARNPQMGPVIRWLAIVGGGLSAISGVVYEVVYTQKAADFVSHGAQTYPQANALTSGGLVVALPVIAQLALLLLTFGFVWISINALRVGLLTRPMGYSGVVIGVFFLFPIGALVPILQGFWLLALAYLISGRWPSGLPPAWTSGQMEPWPSSEQMREMREMRDQQTASRAEQKSARQATEPEADEPTATATATKQKTKASRERTATGRQTAGGNGKGNAKPQPKANAKPSPPAKPAGKSETGKSPAPSKRKRKRRH